MALNRSRTFQGLISLGLMLSVGTAAAATSVPQALSLGGQLFNADGSVIARTGVNFRVQVMDPTQACVLYQEDHAGQDLAASGGRFNLILGGGTSIVNNVGAAGVLDQKVFLNGGSTAVAGCASSPLNLTAGGERQIVVLYDLGAGYTAMTPAVPVVSAPNAMIADTLGGLGATDFIQVNGTSALNQTNTEYAFSLTNWPRLKALLDGNSSQYLASTPTAPLDFNGQRITDVHDPTAAQDAATKHYVDANLGGSGLDVSAVGPSLGAGSTLLWDAVQNKWVAGVASSAPTGAAGGDLTGTYPNPTIANDKITSAKINSTGVAVNRLLITDATTGATVGYGACSVAGQVFAWTASGWACTNVSTLAPVTSVAGKTGAVTLNANDISGLGTAALFDWGTAANQIVRLDAGAALPAVNGAALTQVNAMSLQTRAIASTPPTAGQVLGWNVASSAWEPTTVVTSGGTVTNIASGTGLLGGPITGAGTLSVDVGSAANQIPQLNAGAQLALAAGSATAPAYSFAGNLGTGVFSPAAGGLALSAAGTAAVTIAPSGNVGIGTTAPTSALQVASPTPSTSPTTGAVTVAGGLGIQGDVNTSGNLTTTGNITSQYGSVTAASFVAGTGAGVGLFTTDASKPMTFTPDGTERLRIAVGGNVGIGTNLPQAGLDVSITGTSSAVLFPRDTTANRPTGVNGMLRYNTSLGAFEGYANNVWSTIAAGSAAGTVTNIASGTGLLGGPIITSGTLSVNVGTGASQIVQETGSAQIAQSLGTAAAPAYSFVGALNTGLFAPSAGTLALATNGTSALTVLANGSVGIGTGSPASNLSVIGSVSATVFGNDLNTFNQYLVVNNQIDPGGSRLTAADSINLTVDADNSGVGALNIRKGAMNPATATPLLTITNAGNVGVGTATPQSGLDVALTGTASSAVILPRDTTTNRPAGVNGMLRYNTTNNVFEGFANSVWSTIAAGTAAGTVTNIASGTGLLGGPITTSGTLSVNVGTAANQIPQLNASGQLVPSSGAVGAPVYAFAGSPNTGVYSPSANSVALTANGTAALTVSNAGYVGIGTTAPKAQLHVSLGGTLASSFNPGIGEAFVVSKNSGAGDYAQINVVGGNTGRSVLNLGTDASHNAGYFIYDNNLNALYLGTSATERLRITSTGAVGIGTSAPTSALDIYALGTTASAITIPRDTTTNRPTAGVNGMLRYNTTTNVFEGYANGAWGSLAAGAAGQWSTTGSDIYYNAGKVGIGTNAPAATLDVGGPIYVRGLAALSYPTSDSTAGGSIAIGSGTLLNQSGTAAYANTGVGYQALNGALTTAAVQNTAVGYAALRAVTSGTVNTALGAYAGTNMTTAGNNTTIGQSSGSSLTTGSSNTGVGLASLSTITTTGSNTAIGSNAMRVASGAGASNNTALGDSSLFNVQGSSNLAVGKDSGSSVTTGSNNVLVGTGVAATTLTTGSYNILIGRAVDTPASSTSNFLNVGNLIFATGVNGTLASPAGLVGIGTSVPQAALDVALTGTVASAIIVPRDSSTNRPTTGVNGMLRYNTTLNAFEGYANSVWSTISAGTAAGTVTNVAAGTGLLGGPITSSGTLSVNVGTAANQIPQLNANAQLAPIAGTAALPSHSFAGNLNTGLFSPAAGSLALSANGTAAVTILSNGNVGVGVTNPSTTLYVAATGTVNGSFSPASGDLMVLQNPGAAGNSANAYLISGDGSGAGLYMGGGSAPKAGGVSYAAVVKKFAIYSNNIQAMTVDQLGNVGIGTQNPAGILDLVATGTVSSAMILPRDTSANRPTAAVNGMLRYNTTNGAFEGFASGGWATIAAGSAVGTVQSVATGTGLLGGPITTSGTLSVNVGTAANQIVQLNSTAQVAPAAASAAAPAYAFAGNLNSGVFSAGAGSVSLAANGTAALTVTSAGSVGIGTTAPSEVLEVNGSVKAVSFITTSDRRLKTNIRPVEGWEAIKLLRGVRYKLISTGTEELGLIAQDVEQVFPEAVATDPRSGYKGVKYQALISPLIESVRETHDLCEGRTEDLRRELAAVKAEVSDLRKMVEEMRTELARGRAGAAH